MPDMDEQFQRIVEDLGQRTDKIGLYLETAGIATREIVDEETTAKLEGADGIKEMLEKGEIDLALFATFRLGDIAFSDRVQNPDAYELDTQFRVAMPTAQEIALDKIRQSAEDSDDDDPLSFLRGGDDDDELE